VQSFPEGEPVGEGTSAISQKDSSFAQQVAGQVPQVTGQRFANASGQSVNPVASWRFDHAVVQSFPEGDPVGEGTSVTSQTDSSLAQHLSGHVPQVIGQRFANASGQSVSPVASCRFDHAVAQSFPEGAPVGEGTSVTSQTDSSLAQQLLGHVPQVTGQRFAKESGQFVNPVAA